MAPTTAPPHPPLTFRPKNVSAPEEIIFELTSETAFLRGGWEELISETTSWLVILEVRPCEARWGLEGRGISLSLIYGGGEAFYGAARCYSIATRIPPGRDPIFDQILMSLKTFIFGRPKPWRVFFRIQEGRFPGVPKTLK